MSKLYAHKLKTDTNGKLLFQFGSQVIYLSFCCLEDIKNKHTRLESCLFCYNFLDLGRLCSGL